MVGIPDILSDVQGETGLPHGGTRREDDEITAPQPADQPIQVRVSRGDPSRRVGILGHHIPLSEELGDLFIDVGIGGDPVLLGGLVDGVACPVEEILVVLLLRGEPLGDDLSGGMDHLTQPGFGAYNIRVVLCVGRGGHLPRQLHQVLHTPHTPELVPIAQNRLQCHQINGGPIAVQREHRLKDMLVGRLIKIGGFQGRCHQIDDVVVQQDGP